MKAMQISRHNRAGLLSRKALAQGSWGNCLWITDVSSADDAPDFAAGNRLPQRLLPAVDNATLRRLRPDALRIATLLRNAAPPLTRDARSNHVVDIIEFGYCSNTRMSAKLAEKQTQHGQLKQLLLEAGWKDVKLQVFPLGTLGATHSTSLPALEALGLGKAAATGVLNKLSRHAVSTVRDMIRKKRELEQELWGGPPQHGHRAGVG